MLKDWLLGLRSIRAKSHNCSTFFFNAEYSSASIRVYGLTCIQGKIGLITRCASNAKRPSDQIADKERDRAD